MNKIKLSVILELDNLINDSYEFDSITTNLELFTYVSKLVDYLNEMYFELSFSFLKDNLTIYLEDFADFSKEEYSKDVFEEDYNFIGKVLEELKNTFYEDVQTSYCYIIDDPLRDNNFERRLENLLETAMDYAELKEYDIELNLLDSQKAYAFGLYNASAIYLSIATENYSRFFYSSLNFEGFANQKELNWVDVLRHLKEIRRKIKFPNNLINNLWEIKNENRNKILHKGKQLEDTETTKLIDLCFDSIMEMNKILEENGVQKFSKIS